jgi:branched-chain amino acid transport system substrate-binding protein
MYSFGNLKSPRKTMNITQIGLLLPTSTIFPIGKDFERGLKAGLGDVAQHIEFVKEFIGQGNLKQTEDAITKLFTYDNVDLITGILSGRVTEYVTPKFEMYRKPFVVSELGEYVPNHSRLNEYTFVNSHHLWQHAWALGYWGVNTLGKKGMFIGGVYDAAYSFSHMFYEGMMAADPSSQWSFSIPPNPPAGKLSDMSVIFPFLEKYQPDFVFATFCGTEATLFLNEFIRKGWHKRTQLLGLPFLLAPFAPLEDNITILTTLPDTNMPEMLPKDSFFNLGLRAGKIIAQAANSTDLQEGLRSSDSNMPLGNSNYIVPSGGNRNETITIIENIIKANNPGFEQKVHDTTQTFSLQDENIGKLIPEIQTGWLNPYAG